MGHDEVEEATGPPHTQVRGERVRSKGWEGSQLRCNVRFDAILGPPIYEESGASLIERGFCLMYILATRVAKAWGKGMFRIYMSGLLRFCDVRCIYRGVL